MRLWSYLSVKFYLGLLLVVVSLIIGKVTTFMFVLYFNETKIRWMAMIIYILSWPLLVLGIYWIGKEYSASIKKYITYQYYQESIKQGTRKALYKTKQMGSSVKNKWNKKFPISFKKRER